MQQTMLVLPAIDSERHPAHIDRWCSFPPPCYYTKQPSKETLYYAILAILQDKQIESPAQAPLTAARKWLSLRSCRPTWQIRGRYVLTCSNPWKPIQRREKCDENVMKMWWKCDENVMNMWWKPMTPASRDIVVQHCTTPSSQNPIKPNHRDTEERLQRGTLAAKTQVRKTNISRQSEYRTITHAALPVRLSKTPWKNEWLNFPESKCRTV